MGFVTHDSLRALSEFGFYRAGHLPHAGGWRDQPNRVMEQMRIIEAAVAQAEKDRCQKK